MNNKILSLAIFETWNKLLGALPYEQQDVYFTPAYYSLYEHNGDGKACCFVFEEGGKRVLYPFLMNSVNTLGYDLGGAFSMIYKAHTGTTELSVRLAMIYS